MEKKRKVSVKELVNMFVAISYFQEQRIIKYGDIYDYIDRNNAYCEVEFADLIHEAIDTINELLNNGILTELYSGVGEMYRVNRSDDFFKIANYSKGYLNDMNKAFYTIIGGNEIMEFELTLANNKEKKR